STSLAACSIERNNLTRRSFTRCLTPHALLRPLALRVTPEGRRECSPCVARTLCQTRHWPGSPPSGDRYSLQPAAATCCVNEQRLDVVAGMWHIAPPSASSRTTPHCSTAWRGSFAAV